MTSASRPLARPPRLRNRFQQSGARLAWAALAAVATLTAAPATATALSSPVLDAIRARGSVVCGVAEGSPGFSEVDQRGFWSGLEVDFCGALGAAVLGDKNKVKFRPLTAADRFRVLQSGEVDVLLSDTTWTLSRDLEFGARFAGVLFYDGQGFLVRRGHAVSSVLELSGASVCVLPGTQGETAVSDFFRAQQMRVQLLIAERWSDLVMAYAAGGCTVLSGDVSTLAQERSRLPARDEHLVLPETVTKEPLGPAVRQGDEIWFSIVRWTLMSLTAAEELGITSTNVDAMASSQVVDVRRFLGLEANLGQAMGLPRDWAAQVVRQVGNYQEIFDRNFGAKSTLRLSRGLNALWKSGGLMYAPPFR